MSAVDYKSPALLRQDCNTAHSISTRPTLSLQFSPSGCSHSKWHLLPGYSARVSNLLPALANQFYRQHFSYHPSSAISRRPFRHHHLLSSVKTVTGVVVYPLYDQQVLENVKLSQPNSKIYPSPWPKKNVQ